MVASRWLTAALCAAAFAAAGCGGDDEEETSGGGATQPAAEQTQTGGDAASALGGKDLFAATCGGCHTLKAAGTNGQTGPDLDSVMPDVDRVLTAIKEGPSIMPENLLEGEDAQAVAKFVADSAGK